MGSGPVGISEVKHKSVEEMPGFFGEMRSGTGAARIYFKRMSIL